MSGIFFDNRKNIFHTSFERHLLIPLPIRNRTFINSQHFCQFRIAQPMLIFVPFDLAAKGGSFMIERIVAEKDNDCGILKHAQISSSLSQIARQASVGPNALPSKNITNDSYQT